ncbi:orange carotenoid protein N-terminal domain-containing protein [Candidatus Cyanaurora vandensis]|uniref:orange carotenoid protein N-terminal domain-containing protein n=1 Tax=Candidatus Cyanaurora vandensis TaxID=2714958 RepID=UPI00257CEB36|nr:orange carotenoid protein N-terminal domain-containing protein [Candidatus Cyanaurora vandensis]
MSLTLESVRGIFLETQAPSAIPDILTRFQELNLEDQLALLWYAYTETGRSITRAALGAARMELAEGLLTEIKQMSRPDQTQVMVDLARRADTPFSRTYGVFSVNTKLGFWYRLGELMAQGVVAPIPEDYKMTPEAETLLNRIKKLDGGQQITVLRNTVVDMGYDPLKADNAPVKELDPKFIRPEPAPKTKTLEGITEPAVLGYFEAMNEDRFETAAALFAPEGSLQPPFQQPIVGREGIIRYMREEAQGLNMLPEQGICEVQNDGSKQLKITGKVQTPWFGVNVAMNIAWRFALNTQGEIFFVAIDMLASPEELLNLRPSK